MKGDLKSFEEACKKVSGILTKNKNGISHSKLLTEMNIGDPNLDSNNKAVWQLNSVLIKLQNDGFAKMEIVEKARWYFPLGVN